MRTAESSPADRLRARPRTKKLADCELAPSAAKRRLLLRTVIDIGPAA